MPQRYHSIPAGYAVTNYPLTESSFERSALLYYTFTLESA